MNQVCDKKVRSELNSLGSLKMSSTTLSKVNLSRDVNDNHVQDSSRNTDEENGERSQQVQLVIPEPKRLSPALDLSDRKTARQSPENPSYSHTSIPSAQSAPWQLPGYSGFPPFPFLQYHAFPGYPFPVFPEQMFVNPYSIEYMKNLQNWRMIGSTFFPPLPPYISPGKLQEASANTVKSEDGVNIVSSLAKEEMKDNREPRSPAIRTPTVFLDKYSTPVEKRKEFDSDTAKYRCESCLKSYSTFSGLSKHKQFHCAQDSKKEFSCKYCDKTYVSLGALKMHIRTHTLPCKCKICGKAFSRPWLLQGHIRTHTGEKPFTCCTCLRAFADRSNLRAHLQTHSDVKKYSCRTCSRTFSRMSLLLKHEDSCRHGNVDMLK